MSQPPAPTSQIAAGLQEHLPASLSAVILPLAELLAALLAGRITSSDAEAQLQTELFAELRTYLVDHQLAIGQLSLSVPIAGNEIHIGDLQDVKGIAIGQGSNAQVAEGNSNALAAPGGIAIVVTGISEVMLGYFQQLERDMRRISDAWDYASPAPERLAWIVPKEYRTEKDCPYPGLDSFTQQDVYRFFGRIDDVASFLARDHTPLAAITSRNSGVGKSSFVHAGVIPAMERAAEAMSQTLHVLTYKLSTRSDILADFAYMLATTTQSDEAALLTAFRHDDMALVNVLRHLRTTPTTHVLLVLDQFEELFYSDEHTVGNDRRHLLNNLMQVANEDAHWLTVLIVGRQSFYDHVDFRDRGVLVQNLDVAHFELRGLTDLQLTQAIEGPLQVFYQRTGEVVRCKDGLVTRILRDFLDVPGLKQSALPLLQFLLVRLWTEHGQLDIDHYDRLGGIGRAFVDRADTIYFGFQGSRRRVADAILIALVQPGLEPEDPTEDRPLVRRRASISERIFDDPQRPEIKKVVTDLWNSRITTQRPGPEQMISFEITHEVLLDTWPVLRQLQNSYLDIINQRERLLPLAEQWRREQQPRYLYQSSDIGDAKKYLDRANAEPLLDEVIRRCYEASIAYQKKLRWRNFMFGVSGLLFTIIIAALATLLFNASLREQVGRAGVAQATAQAEAATQSALKATADARAESRRRTNQSQELAAKAQSLLETSPETALLLAYEAASIDSNPLAHQVLRDGIQRIPWEVVALNGHQAAVTDLTISPDGTQFLSASSDGTARLWNINGQVITTLKEHTSSVNGAIFSPDGSRILTWSDDGRLLLWSKTGEQQAVLLGLRGRVVHATFSPNGSQIAAVADNRSGGLWSPTGEKLASFTDDTSIAASNAARVQFRPDGQRFVVTWSNSAVIYDESGNMIASLKSIEDWLAMDISADGQHIALGNGLNQIVLTNWEGTDQVEIQVQERSMLQGTQGGVRDLVFSSDSERVFVVSDDSTNGGAGIGSIWDLSGQRLATLVGHTAPVKEVLSYPGNEWFLTASTDRTAKLWSYNGELLLTLSGHQDALTSIAASATVASDIVITADTAGVIRIWKLVGRQLPLIIMPGKKRIGWARYLPDGQQILTHSDNQTALFNLAGELQHVIDDTSLFTNNEISPDGQRILQLTNDSRARVLDTTGKITTIFGDSDGSANASGSTIINSAEFTPDARNIVSVSKWGRVQVWSQQGQKTAELVFPDRYESAAFVEVSADSRHILLVIDKNESLSAGKARLWTIDGTPLVLLDSHQDAITAAAFSPDGATILTLSADRTGRLWDLAGNVLASFTSPEMQNSYMPPRHAQFSPDGERFLSMTTGHPLAHGLVQLWDREGRLLATLITECKDLDMVSCRFATDAQFSPDGQRIVVIVDGRARLYDKGGVLVADLIGHEGSINSAAFSPDGRWVATAADDGTARLWRYDGVLETTFRGYSRNLTGVQFSPDARRLLTTSIEGVVDQHLIEVADLLTVAACRVGRGLSEQEMLDLQVPTPVHFSLVNRQCPAIIKSSSKPAHSPATPVPLEVSVTALARPTYTPTPTSTPTPSLPTPILGISGEQRFTEGIYIWKQDEVSALILRFYQDGKVLWFFGSTDLVYDRQGRMRADLPQVFSRDNLDISLSSAKYRLFGERLEFVAETRYADSGRLITERYFFSGAYKPDLLILTITVNRGHTQQEFESNRTVIPNVEFVPFGT